MDFTHEKLIRRYIDDALGRSEKLISESLDNVAEHLLQRADAALTGRERQRFADLAFGLRRSQRILVRAFVRELEQALDAELVRILGRTAHAAPKKVDIELALVDEEKVEEDIAITKLIHQIEEEAGAEVRDLTSRMSALSGHPDARPEHNPLRPEVFGRSIQRAIRDGGFEPSARVDLLRSMGGALSSALKQTYKLYNDQLEAQNIQPMRVVPPRPAHSGWSGAMGSSGSSGSPGSAGSGISGVQGTLAQDGMAAATAARDASEWLTAEALQRLFRGESLQGLSPDQIPTRPSGFQSSDPGPLPRTGHGALLNDALLANVALRDALNRVAGLGSIASGGGAAHAFMGVSGVGTEPVNVIREFREDLVAATTRPLEKLTIDVVAMMFDHILADRRLHPEAKASLGRLQIPVLRIALQDASLFSDRSHPTRRLINRIAAYSSGFQKADELALREFLETVDQVVETIVNADDADAGLFDLQLQRLERLISTQSERQQRASGDAVAALERAEFRTLLRRNLSQQIDRLLVNVEVDEFVKVFLREQWMAVLVECVVMHGESAPLTQQMKQTGSDLLWSVQPKVDKADRAHLIYLLPRMIRTLQDGLKLIQWDQAAHQQFFSDLMLTHTKVVRASGHSNTVSGDLEELQARWERAFDGSLRKSQDLLGLDVDIAVLEQERLAAQLVDEADLLAEPMLKAPVMGENPAPPVPGMERPEPVLVDEPAAEASGSAIRDVRVWVDELAVGSWLRMRLQGQWAQAQLIWRSPQGLFFMFSSNVGGKAHSMTRRALERLCGDGGVRSLEDRGLIDRAVDEVMERARQRPVPA